VLQKGIDVGGRGDGVGTIRDGGSTLCYDQEVV